MIRRVNKDGNCSWLFDPVGPDAVDDGDVVTQLFDVRVRAEDNGNTALTGEPDWVPIGGVDQGQVQLFILNNISRPLVVDTSDPPTVSATTSTLTWYPRQSRRRTWMRRL